MNKEDFTKILKQHNLTVNEFLDLSDAWNQLRCTLLKTEKSESLNTKKQEINETFGLLYGNIHPQYGGLITNLATLPDKTYSYVTNGNWDGYVDSDDNGNKIIYCGVDNKNPTENYTNKITLGNNDKYDAAISHIHPEMSFHK